MTLISGTFEQEAMLSLYHVNQAASVMEKERVSGKQCGSVICYVTKVSFMNSVAAIFNAQDMVYNRVK